MADTTEQSRDFARSLISHPVAFGTIEHTERAGEMLTALLAERDALAAKLEQAREALAVCERAADMLTAYAELIRRDGASRIDQHHYLPEVEHVAQTLRDAAPPPALFVPDDAALAQEPAHTDHPARHFDRTCPACAQADILARYSLDDGRREWVNVGTWLHPGEVIAHMDGASLAQEPAAPAPAEPSAQAAVPTHPERYYRL